MRLSRRGLATGARCPGGRRFELLDLKRSWRRAGGERRCRDKVGRAGHAGHVGEGETGVVDHVVDVVDADDVVDAVDAVEKDAAAEAASEGSVRRDHGARLVGLRLRQCQQT